MSCADSQPADPTPDAGRDGSMPDAAMPDAAMPDAATQDGAQLLDASDASQGPRFPCGTTTAQASGLELCEAGRYVRRSGPASCTSSVPRDERIEGIYPDQDQCHRDSECEHLHLGHCAEREGGNTLVCVAGCETDADCEEGRVCYCGESSGYPVGRCVPAGCESSADCADGYECVLSVADEQCPLARFECQTPDDSCGSYADCAGFSPNPTFCVFSEGSFHCSITQCTQP